MPTTQPQPTGFRTSRSASSGSWGVEGILGRWFRGAERTLGRLARHRALSILLVGLLSFITSAALSLLVRMPQPHIADEFDYLLTHALPLEPDAKPPKLVPYIENIVQLPRSHEDHDHGL
jgi:hypothetical protein